MSAFMVSEECMQGAVRALVGNPGEWPSFQLDALGRELFALNALALKARYNDDEPPPDFNYKAECKIEDVQAFKNLCCLHYQCSEGNIPETSSLYKYIEERIEKLSARIDRSSHEYDLATWG